MRYRYYTFLMTLFFTLSFNLWAESLTPPTELVIHNLTEFESNAFVNDLVASPLPTKPHSTHKVPWMMVLMLCAGQTSAEGLCPATIKMATNTMAPIVVGYVMLNTKTGEITPKLIQGNGFKMTVDETKVGVATIEKT